MCIERSSSHSNLAEEKGRRLTGVNTAPSVQKVALEEEPDSHLHLPL